MQISLIQAILIALLGYLTFIHTPFLGPNLSDYDTKIKYYISKKPFDFSGNLAFSKFLEI